MKISYIGSKYEEKLLSLRTEKSGYFLIKDYKKTSITVSIEKPISLIDFSLKFGETMTSVKKIIFFSDRIEFNLLFEMFCLPYSQIRSIELSHDLNTCKCLLFIKMKSSLVNKLSNYLKAIIQSKSLKILFSDPIHDIKNIMGQIFRYIDCKFVSASHSF